MPGTPGQALGMGSNRALTAGGTWCIPWEEVSELGLWALGEADSTKLSEQGLQGRGSNVG